METEPLQTITDAPGAPAATLAPFTPAGPLQGLPSVGIIVPIVLAPRREAEIIRATVTEVYNKDEIQVALTVMPPMMSKSHSYTLGDIVHCKRVRTALGDRWEDTA